MNPGQIFGVFFVAHGRADAGIDGQGDALGAPADPVRDAPDVLAFFALHTMRIESPDHVDGALTFALLEVAQRLRTSVVQQEIRAQVIDDALLHATVLSNDHGDDPK